MAKRVHHRSYKSSIRRPGLRKVVTALFKSPRKTGVRTKGLKAVARILKLGKKGHI